MSRFQLQFTPRVSWQRGPPCPRAPEATGPVTRPPTKLSSARQGCPSPRHLLCDRGPLLDDRGAQERLTRLLQAQVHLTGWPESPYSTSSAVHTPRAQSRGRQRVTGARQKALRANGARSGGKSWLPSLLLALTFPLFNRVTIVGFSRQARENPTPRLKQPKVFIEFRVAAVRAAKVASSHTSVSRLVNQLPAALRAQAGTHARVEPATLRVMKYSPSFSQTAPGECHTLNGYSQCLN